MRTGAYFRWLAGTMTVLAVAVLGLTIATDPYRAFGTPAVTGWTALKPRAYQQVGIAKLYQLDRIAPATLVLGNSRTEIGLDPESTEWPATLRPVFNAAMAGGTVYTSLLMLREDLALRRPKMIVLGLDFQDFLTEVNDPTRSIDDERRLLVDAAGQPNLKRYLQIWTDRLTSTLTINAVADSILTLLDQDPTTSATMTRFGFNPLHDYRVFATRSGYQGLFEQKNALYHKQYSTYAKPDLAHPRHIAAYRNLTLILQQAAEHRIPVTLYIHPYHARFLNMLSEVGLWQSFEEWKRLIVNTVGEIVTGTLADTRIFDFSGFNEFAVEPVPPQGDRHTVMRWYWEPGHYKSALGERILARIFHEEGPFGYVLSSENIESVLSKIRGERIRLIGQSATKF